MNDLKYQLSRMHSGIWSPVHTLADTVQTLKLHINPLGDGPYRLWNPDEGNHPGPQRTWDEAIVHLKAQDWKPGTKVQFLPDSGRFNWVFRSVHVNLAPDAPDEATGPIKRIWTAAWNEFDEQYGLVNLGIKVSKPGEHSVGNAWDIGVLKPSTSDGIHNAITDIANWLRGQMMQAIQDGGGPGLPVGGDIVMSQWCARDSTNWSYYSGIPHVSHCHVSGYPELVSGWI
jgi:hypothetical protein